MGGKEIALIHSDVLSNPGCAALPSILPLLFQRGFKFCLAAQGTCEQSRDRRRVVPGCGVTGPFLTQGR